MVNDVLGTIKEGYNLGAGIRSNIEQRKQKDLLGGMRRKSLGLGGESEEEQMQARTQMAATSPEDYDKFFKTYTNLGSEEKERIKKENGMIGIAAGNLLELEDPKELIFGLTQTAKAFESSGSPKLAQRTVQLAQLAQEDPAAAREQLKALHAQSQDIDKLTKGGLASATTTTWRNGTTLFNLPNGSQRLVFQGREITDPKEIEKVIKNANDSGLALAGQEAFTKASKGAQGAASGEVEALPDIKQVIEEKAVTEKLSEDLANAYSEIETYESNMPTLKKDLDYLKELNNKATYTAAGKLLDWGMRQSGMYPREAAIAASTADAFVLTNVLPQLKLIFGGAISDAELKVLRDTWGDPNKSPAEKNAALDAQMRVSQGRIDRSRERVERHRGKQTTQPTQTTTQPEQVDPLGLR